MSWGPLLLAPDRTRFALWAPALDALTLEIDGPPPLAMAPAGDGWFAVEAACGAGARYRFRLPDGAIVPDPASRAQDGGVHGWSIVTDPAGYRWQAQEWRGRPWREAVIHEVHVGAAGGYAGLAEMLPGLAAIGFTAIELMPLAAFGGTRNWGYDGVLPYAPAASYGTPDDLRALIDAAHGQGLMVLLDVVYNHFGPDGNYLSAYAPDFFKADVHTPWGGAIDFGRAPVAQFFIDNALYWLRDFRFDGLRFDAVHAIADNAFLDRMAAEIRAGVPDRHIHLVLENEHNDAARLETSYDAQWNDDFHNVLHVLLTYETHGYYKDFAEAPAERLARCLAEGFIYQGQGSPNQKGKPRGSPSGHLPPTRFVSFLQNHDQIGNRALGERLTLLTSRERLRAATGLLLLCPQIPLTFMGDETGSESPFLFFTDFHDELADAVREGRRGEFAGHPGFADESARDHIPDPNARTTFDRSRALPGPDADAWRALYTQLLVLRRERIMPRLDDAAALGAEAIGAKAVVARWRIGAEQLTLAINLGDDAVPFAAPEATLLVAIGAETIDGTLPSASFAAWIA
ncbi:malto-oligosyltrehalose trehalohydrolase [Sphingomonas nostoxanthinifaciens]|uniref:malto-oligosyltrehalose trehalohydrolase n=1 Tax=Sphingomonas nostoxanthinifaciens TaxID=2872652 RepID=UPI001CC21D49|nr:malto-oligosyltrehalose trehalohydrolase [Sphingomonas nostoxanthinifaciens]UAK23308.1 malto-oligosyltrehalose trehalohydrolase [Sphingomonas nostoxanthinifaciens]